MDKIKNLFVLLIALSVFVQIGKIFLNNTQYEKIYKFISSFFIVIIVITYIFSLGRNESNIDLFSKTYFKSDNTDIKNNFENKLAQTIETNIHNIFYVNYSIKVETDFKQLKIYILGKGTATDDDVKNYIVNNYCTSKDEVYIIHENE